MSRQTEPAAGAVPVAPTTQIVRRYLPDRKERAFLCEVGGRGGIWTHHETTQYGGAGWCRAVEVEKLEADLARVTRECDEAQANNQQLIEALEHAPWKASYYAEHEKLMEARAQIAAFNDMRCETCKYWGNATQKLQDYRGVCNYFGRKFTVTAVLYTAKDFGCVQWEKK